jgi:hypothetical protein
MSIQLGGLLLWLAATVAGCVIWRSGDRIGGRGLAFIGATNSVCAAGIWLVSLGVTWVGYALVAVALGIYIIALVRIDRSVLRAIAPMLLLAAAAIAAIWLTELASWLGARREVILILLGLVIATTVAFLSWMLLSTVRLTKALARRAQPPRD